LWMANIEPCFFSFCFFDFFLFLIDAVIGERYPDSQGISVRNVPVSWPEAAVRSIFSEYGEVAIANRFKTEDVLFWFLYYSSKDPVDKLLGELAGCLVCSVLHFVWVFW
jgi:hypothetical protein